MASHLQSFVAFLLLASAYGKSIAPEAGKVDIEVYFESLCPDSIRLITTQLAPAWRHGFKAYMNVTLVPFGKASWAHNRDGSWTFSCQHGQGECEGNKMLGCGLEQLRESNPDQQVPFVDCVMGSDYPPDSGRQCATSLNMDFESLDECSKGERGSVLLSQNGILTENLDPALTYVPWIVINEKFTKANLNAAQRDLPSLLCSNLDQKPEVCK